MNDFDSAFATFHDTGSQVMGEPVTIDGKDITAIVTPVDRDDRRTPGVHVFSNAASVFITPEDFITLGGYNGVSGKIVVVRSMRMRVDTIQDGGATGAELYCNEVEQRKSIPRV